MKSGEEGKVLLVEGGHKVAGRLQAMGVRPGLAIRKISSMMFFGPISVKVGNTTLSMGHGMASKIMVEVDR